MKLERKYILELIKRALDEDNSYCDITTRSLIPPTQRITVEIISKDTGIICGLDIAREIFKFSDKNCIWRAKLKDGDKIKPNTTVAIIKGSARNILSKERTVLNFLQHLSGISTLTNKFVKKIKNRVKIYDTRKTLPGLRKIEKYAVLCGGGYNHRNNLSEMVLIKDNHLKVCSQIKLPIIQGINSVYYKIPRGTKIEMEVQNLRQLNIALKSNCVNIIMLDNMSVKTLKKAIKIIRKVNKNIEIEVSGGINFKNIEKISKLDIDRISIGSLTNSAPILDISLEIV